MRHPNSIHTLARLQVASEPQFSFKLPRRRNRKISRAIQAAVHVERRTVQRQKRIAQLREVEIGQQHDQQARQTTLNKSVLEAEISAKAILAHKSIQEVATRLQENQQASILVAVSDAPILLLYASCFLYGLYCENKPGGTERDQRWAEELDQNANKNLCSNRQIFAGFFTADVNGISCGITKLSA